LNIGERHPILLEGMRDFTTFFGGAAAWWPQGAGVQADAHYRL